MDLISAARRCSSAVWPSGIDPCWTPTAWYPSGGQDIFKKWLDGEGRLPQLSPWFRSDVGVPQASSKRVPSSCWFPSMGSFKGSFKLTKRGYSAIQGSYWLKGFPMAPKYGPLASLKGSEVWARHLLCRWRLMVLWWVYRDPKEEGPR